jgi:hypothetical protein
VVEGIAVVVEGIAVIEVEVEVEVEVGLIDVDVVRSGDGGKTGSWGQSAVYIGVCKQAFFFVQSVNS